MNVGEEIDSFIPFREDIHVVNDASKLRQSILTILFWFIDSGIYPDEPEILDSALSCTNDIHWYRSYILLSSLFCTSLMVDVIW